MTIRRILLNFQGMVAYKDDAVTQPIHEATRRTATVEPKGNHVIAELLCLISLVDRRQPLPVDRFSVVERAALTPLPIPGGHHRL